MERFLIREFAGGQKGCVTPRNARPMPIKNAGDFGGGDRNLVRIRLFLACLGWFSAKERLGFDFQNEGSAKIKRNSTWHGSCKRRAADCENPFFGASS